jgi:hypothetical protein
MSEKNQHAIALSNRVIVCLLVFRCGVDINFLFIPGIIRLHSQYQILPAMEILKRRNTQNRVVV